MTISEKFIDRLASILADVGQVVLASVVLNPLFSQDVGVFSIIAGVIATVAAWGLSLLLSR